MKDWLPMADAVLDELVRRDGRGDFRKFDQCLSCADRATASPATIRCTSCDVGPLECEGCCVKRHRRNACHRLMVRRVLSVFGTGLTIYHSDGMVNFLK